MDGFNLLLSNFNKGIAMRLVDLRDPNRIHELKQQEVTVVRVTLKLIMS
jgi:hypothetical protein